jgi:putative oxidoreductase
MIPYRKSNHKAWRPAQKLAKTSIQKSSKYAALPLRLIVGYGFMAHAAAKLSRGSEAFAMVLHALGVPAPHFMAWLTIAIELIGGFGILVGAFMPFITIPLAGVLVVAMVTVHLRFGFSSIKLMNVVNGHPQFGPPGYECDLLYIACMATLLMLGPGVLSFDSYRKATRSLCPR